MHYQVFGSGPVTVYLHGFLESSSMWEPLDLKNLPGTHLLIDLPGHGKSSLSDKSKEPSIRFMADEVCRVLEKLQIQSYRVVGHSMGGYVALELFAQPSIGVSPNSVVLLNSNCWADTEAKKSDRLRVAKIAYTGKMIFINEAIPNLFARPLEFIVPINALKAEAAKISAETIAYSALAMRNRCDYTSLVLENPKQFTIIHGAMDRLVSVEELYEKLGTKKGKDSPKLIILSNAGHMAHWESKKDVVAAIGWN